MENHQIDIAASPWRGAALVLGSCVFVAFGAWLLYARPNLGHGRNVEPGSFVEFIAIACVLFFGLCAIVAALRAFRTGPVVSIGTLGVFDRRLSMDWIPWDAIVDIGTVTMRRSKILVLIVDKSREAELPFRKSARRLAKMNAGFGVYGYWIAAVELEGGFDELEAAMALFDRRSAAST